MTRVHVFGTATLLLCSLALAPIAAEQPADSGKQIYLKFCSSCHGSDGRGGTDLGKLFLKPPPDLTRIASRRDGWFPEVIVKEIVDGRFAAHGTREMPVWGETLGPNQLTLVTEYLFRIQDDSKPAAP